MAITQATSSVLAANAALNNLNAGANITFTKQVIIPSLGGSAFGTGVTTALAATANTGGGLVTANGTSTLTNKTIDGANNTITNVSITSGVSGLGTGVAAFLNSPTSDNLRAAVTGETGTDALVFNNGPTLIAPNIGAATGTSLSLTNSAINSHTATFTNNASGQYVAVFQANAPNLTVGQASFFAVGRNPATNNQFSFGFEYAGDGSNANRFNVNAYGSAALFSVLASGQNLMPINIASTNTTSGTLVVTGGVGIGGNINIGGNISAVNATFSGHLAAATKSFKIPHQTKDGYLQYGVVESNEHSVYVRGKTSEETITLPDHWSWLVDPNSVTVSLTPYGNPQSLYVISADNQKVYVGGVTGEYSYVVYGTRQDVEALIVETEE
jgi:hypothetical protein